MYCLCLCIEFLRVCFWPKLATSNATCWKYHENKKSDIFLRQCVVCFFLFSQHVYVVLCLQTWYLNVMEHLCYIVLLAASQWNDTLLTAESLLHVSVVLGQHRTHWRLLSCLLCSVLSCCRVSICSIVMNGSQ